VLPWSCRVGVATSVQIRTMLAAAYSPQAKVMVGIRGKGHLRDAHCGNLRGTRISSSGAHADGADPAVEVSGLMGV
jgi:hypothetical protein